MPRAVPASPLAGYRRLSDQPIKDWREAIDQVQRIGGWRAAPPSMPATACRRDWPSSALPLPDNTAPMMTGEGPLGAVGMGGMFSVVKVRRDLKPGDYADPGWFRHPPGTVAYEYSGALPDSARPAAEAPAAKPAPAATAGAKPAPAATTAARPAVEVKVRKPTGSHGGHH